MESPKIRRRSPSFDDHFTQARLFYESQSPAEKEHIVAAFRFELSKVEIPAIRQRVVDNLAHVDAKLARRIAEPLGIEAPDAKAAAGRSGFRDYQITMPITESPSLSMMRSHKPDIATRKVAVLVADGVDLLSLKAIQQALTDAGAMCKVIGPKLGTVATASGKQLPVDHTFTNMPSVMFDAILVAGGQAASEEMSRNGEAIHYVLEAYKHFKSICALGDGASMLISLGIGENPDADDLRDHPGVIVGDGTSATNAATAESFIKAIDAHRHWERPHTIAVPA